MRMLVADIRALKRVLEWTALFGPGRSLCLFYFQHSATAGNSEYRFRVVNRFRGLMCCLTAEPLLTNFE